MFSGIPFITYAVTDIKKARAFYEGVLGLKAGSEFPADDKSMWIEYEVGPNTLTIGCSPDWKPSSDGSVATLEAIDFDATIKKLKDAGVVFRLEPQDFPPCNMAVIKDPDGNCIMIHRKKV